MVWPGMESRDKLGLDCIGRNVMDRSVEVGRGMDCGGRRGRHRIEEGWTVKVRNGEVWQD